MNFPHHLKMRHTDCVFALCCCCCVLDLDLLLPLLLRFHLLVEQAANYISCVERSEKKLFSIDAKVRQVSATVMKRQVSMLATPKNGKI